jgi:prophage regulatory protein
MKIDTVTPNDRAVVPALLKLPQVLIKFPVSRSGWLAGVKAGKYPAPVRLSARAVAWRAADIDALVAGL